MNEKWLESIKEDERQGRGGIGETSVEIDGIEQVKIAGDLEWGGGTKNNLLDFGREIVLEDAGLTTEDEGRGDLSELTGLSRAEPLFFLGGARLAGMGDG